MNAIYTYCFYAAALALLAASFFRDRAKTRLSLKRAWAMFVNMLPQFVAILLFTGLLLAVLPPETVQRSIGEDSGFPGMLLTSLVGAVTVVPVLVAFPIAAELLRNGAGISQIVVFVSTLTTVGIVTLPMEMKYLGKKAAVFRNLFAYLFAFITACIMGVLLR